MNVRFDPVKDAENVRKHGVSLQLAEGMDLETALLILDERFSYGEERWTAINAIGDRVYLLAYVDIDDDTVRAISLREATKQEVRLWQAHRTSTTPTFPN
jgi:uncharacterized DUF497 family protein